MSETSTPPAMDAAQDWPVFQMMDPEMERDKYGYFRGLREKSRVWWVEIPGGPDLDVAKRWLVPTRYEDIREAHLNPDLRQKPNEEDDLRDPNKKTVWQTYSEQMQTADPPVHTRRRKLFTKAFTMRRIELLRPALEKMTEEQLEILTAKGADGAVVDLMSYAWSVPIKLICELIGVPEEHAAPFVEWEERTRSHTGGMMGFDDLAERVVASLKELVVAKRANPQDDLLSELIQVQDAEDGRLSEHELVSMCLSLLVSGHEPNVDLIGNGLSALLCHPDEFDRLRADRSLLSSAVEEFLRYDGAQFLNNPRFAAVDTVVAGTKVPKGSVVLLPLGAANHDPDKFPDPERLDITRDTTGHLALGFGIHHCLGAAMARMVGEVCIGGLIDRFPHVRLAVEPDEVRYVPGPLARTLVELPVVLEDAS